MENGTSWNGLFAALYCVPAGYIHLRWMLHRPSKAQIPAILGVSVGGLVILALVCTALMPALLRSFGRAEQAALFRRAAFLGIPYGTLFTLLWTIPFLPVGPLGLLAGVAGGVAAFVGLWWIDRRWLHVGVFKWRR